MLKELSEKQISEDLERQAVVHKSASCTAISSPVTPVINPPELVTGIQYHFNPAHVWFK